MDNSPITEDSAANLQAIKDMLAELVRHASVSRLKGHADCQDIEVSELAPDFVPSRILANNMAFILISGNPVRVTFKAHFNTRTARNLAYRSFGGESEDDVSQQQAFDFFKEYCNLVGGALVTRFEDFNVDLGIGLPLCTRGFYEVFADYKEKQYPIITYSDFWRLAANGHEIHCSALLEIIDRKPLECLIGFEIPEDSGNEVGMEFL